MKLFAIVAIFTACAGCGSIGIRSSTYGHRPHRKFVYPGIQIDAEWVAAPFNEKTHTPGSYFFSPWPLAVVGIVDFPFSLVLDTLCLPYDIWAVTVGSQALTSLPGLPAVGQAQFIVETNSPEFVYTVGTDTNGVPVQQVEWLYRNADLKEQQCPIWAGSPVTIGREENGAFRVRCDTAALPDEKKWHESVLQGNVVTGWLKKDAVIKVRVSDWKKNSPTALPVAEGAR